MTGLGVMMNEVRFINELRFRVGVELNERERVSEYVCVREKERETL